MSEYTLWVAGSRSFETWRGEYIFERYAEEAVAAFGGHPGKVITGACPEGIDDLGSEWARAWSIPVVEYPAEWHLYPGNQAAYVRNKMCAEKAERAFIIWDGVSKGTRMSIDLALDKGMPMVLYVLPGWRKE